MDIFVRPGDRSDHYHTSNRGACDGPLFLDTGDFERFLTLLYIANNSGHFVLRDIRADDIFSVPRSKVLVDITAYCLLPDRYHIILRDREPGGMRHFLHKVGTAYCMYYNQKYRHKGTVFAGTYRARRVTDRSRLYELVGRIHLYPSFDGNVDSGSDAKPDKERALDLASRYGYSSMRDYLGEARLQKAILQMDAKI